MSLQSMRIRVLTYLVPLLEKALMGPEIPDTMLSKLATFSKGQRNC
jgi:hypothetical protein